MDFGKLSDISKVDFTLPSDHFFNEIILTEEQKNIQIFIGPPVWSNREWIGKIYPNYAKESDFLRFYSQQFNTIELNVTHYQIPTIATITRWKESTKDGFKFCAKFPQAISHEKQLIGCQLLTSQFIDSILQLDNKLGCTFLQLNPGFDTKRLAILEKYLSLIPSNFPLSIEFRHPSWFQEKNTWIQTLKMLNERNIGTVMSDVSGRRDVLHMSLSNSTLMVRFVGNELHPTDFTRIEEWVEKIIVWIKKGIQTIYFFVHCGENTYAPELTKYCINQLNLKGRLSIKPPLITQKLIQTTLF